MFKQIWAKVDQKRETPRGGIMSFLSVKSTGNFIELLLFSEFTHISPGI